MIMRKFLNILTTCICLLAILSLLPVACAEGGTNGTIIIGDGAPIPYLDGFQSRLINNVDSIKGITGSLSGLQVSEPSDTGTNHYQLQNLVLTDDVLGLFYIQTYSEPIQYEEASPFGYSFATMFPDILVDGESLDILNQFCEGHPIDAHSQYSFVLLTLSSPIKDGQVLTFAPTWNVDKQTWSGGVKLTVDRSQAKDATVAYQPATHVQKKITLWKGEHAVDYDFTVERVAYTPFGNRVLINFTGTCESNQYLDFQLQDENGKALNIVPMLLGFNTTASAEHPVSKYNEAWFFGGENSQTLTLVPIGGDEAQTNNVNRVACVKLDKLPAGVLLEGGVTLHVESCDITGSGFYTLYSTDGYAGYVSFDLGDANGNSLGLNYNSYTLDNHNRGLLGYGGYWSEEYKGKEVPRVTPEQLSQIRTLLINYTAGAPTLLESEAIKVNLTN
jgi:hypothetical protein